jgi:glycosyltransferase involved in cell wall biosynthesis
MPDGHGALTGRQRILHLSADYPDLIDPRKTPVIARLIELVEDRFDHRVISLNRRTPNIARVFKILTGRVSPAVEGSIRAIEGGECLEYLAPPKGILHAAMLERLAAWIVQRLIAQDAVPDLVIGHKLTVEGLIARSVATSLGIPYALTIQGNTDQKILSFRRDLAAKFGTVYHDAACVFSFAPWARRAVEQRLGQRSGLTFDLPCPTVNDTILAPVARGDGVISAFHLRNHAIKNLAGLAAAVRSAAAAGQPCEVRIFGGGTPEETAQCQAIIREVPGIHLMGPRTQDELGPIMNGATAFVMPSKRESFGLVFIEALFAGLPIIYPQHASVDGYFDGFSFAIGVNAGSTREINAAIRHVIDREAELKADLAQWQASGGLERFSRSAITRTFAEGLDGALAGNGLPVPDRNNRSQSAQDH